MPSITSTSATSPSSRSTAYWATEAPTLPAPTTVIFARPVTMCGHPGVGRPHECGRSLRSRHSWLDQGVEGGAGLEPADLLLGQGVTAVDRHGLASGLGDHDLHRLAGRQRRKALDRQAVRRVDEVVVLRVLERQGQHALLLEVGLGDAGEAP